MQSGLSWTDGHHPPHSWTWCPKIRMRLMIDCVFQLPSRIAALRNTGRNHHRDLAFRFTQKLKGTRVGRYKATRGIQ